MFPLLCRRYSNLPEIWCANGTTAWCEITKQYQVNDQKPLMNILQVHILPTDALAAGVPVDRPIMGGQVDSPSHATDQGAVLHVRMRIIIRLRTVFWSQLFICAGLFAESSTSCIGSAAIGFLIFDEAH